MNSWKKIETKSKMMILSGSAIVLSFALAFFAIIPGMEDIANIRESILGQKIELETKYNRSMSQKKLLERLKAIEPKINKLDGIFINTAKQLEFITALEGVATKNRVVQKITLPSNLALNPASSPVKGIININANGSYPDIIRYLESLEGLDFYINIQSFSMSRTIEGINMNLSANAYFN